MTESNERKPKPDAGHPLLQALIDSIQIFGKRPCWNYGAMYDVRDALYAAAAPQAQPSEQQAAKRRISVHGPGTWMSHPEVPQAQPAPADIDAHDPQACKFQAGGAPCVHWCGDPVCKPVRRVAPIADALAHLRNSISWMLHGKKDGPCIGVADMQTILAALAARSPEPAPISDERIDALWITLLGEHPTLRPGDLKFVRRFARALLAEKGKP